MIHHRTSVPDDWQDEIDLRVARARIRRRPAPPQSASDPSPDLEKPLPKRVLVDRCAHHAPVIWFFIGIHADGTREALGNTRQEQIAREEVERYARLGIPMEVYKPWR